MITSTGIQLIGFAEDILDQSEETSGYYLAHVLALLAEVPAPLTHAAMAEVVGRVMAGRTEGTDVLFSSDMLDQSEDVAEYVPVSISSSTLYTLLCRASELPEAELTHVWVMEETARIVRNYRDSDRARARLTGKDV